MGVPLYRWLVYVMENPNLKWMMTGGAPISGKPQIDGESGKILMNIDYLGVPPWIGLREKLQDICDI